MPELHISDIEAMAAWLRQRDGESDAAWIERLQAVFTMALDTPDDPKADKLADRRWERYKAHLEREKPDT